MNDPIPLWLLALAIAVVQVTHGKLDSWWQVALLGLGCLVFIVNTSDRYEQKLRKKYVQDDQDKAFRRLTHMLTYNITVSELATQTKRTVNQVVLACRDAGVELHENRIRPADVEAVKEALER
jgi:hypothetical protein